MENRYFIFCKDALLLVQNQEGSYGIPTGDEPPLVLKPWTHLMKVTCLDGEVVHTFRISDIPQMVNGKTGSDESEPWKFITLRQSYYYISHTDYQKAGKCQELLYWNENTKFCGVCGGMMHMHTEISKRCEHCGKEVWPQLATAIIVLIQRDDEVLLVHARNFRRDFYGLVAGFVETGETLEEAVHREVKEETGLTIKNLRYFGSQPWPYPCGLMVGFNAEYAGGEIKLQREEIATGNWFKREHLPKIPEKLSIARQLIDSWLNKKEEG